jgi:hypothetical protein
MWSAVGPLSTPAARDREAGHFPTAIGTAQGQSIFRALAEVSSDVIRTLHDATKAPN